MLKISGYLVLTGSFLCALQTATGPPAFALDRWIEFTNNTRMAIAEIYISRVGAQVWNVDLLGPDLLAPASSVSVNNRRWSGLSIRPQNRLRRWHHPDPPKRECMRRGEICDLLSIARGAEEPLFRSSCPEAFYSDKRLDCNSKDRQGLSKMKPCPDGRPRRRRRHTASHQKTGACVLAGAPAGERIVFSAPNSCPAAAAS